jgi:monofunctional biosynthetic peptidoglycan transglycosylase
LAGRLIRLAILTGLVAVAWVALYAAAPPPTTLLIEIERRRLGGVERTWRPLEAISPHLARAVVAAEDARFCAHRGFDLDAIRQAWAERARGRFRGASTITQQVAKNAFLWPTPSWTRKGLEVGFALLIEALWSKRRILEVYLNIAEMGEGVFGAEAAARNWFGKGADALTLAEAARIAAILPAPRSRSASRPGDFTARRARAIAEGARTVAATGADACFLPK